MTEHTSEQVIIQTYASRPVLTDQPHLVSATPEIKWFADGSNFVLNGERKARYAMVSNKKVIGGTALTS
jgi:hypothetical protein